MRLRGVGSTHDGRLRKVGPESDLDATADCSRLVVRGVAPPTTPARTISRLQSLAGNRAVQRVLAPIAGPLHLQRWTTYSTEFAEQLADGRKIKLFDDRIDHIVERHGPEGEAAGAGFFRLLTDKKASIKGMVYEALNKGRVTKSPGQAFDFEKTFDNVIGKDTTGAETKRLRVVVVELGKSGSAGKVQTAYPIAE